MVNGGGEMKLRTAIKLLGGKIKVLGHEYEILFPYIFTERADIKGQCDHDLRQIKIVEHDSCGNKFPESSLWQVFIHEVVHLVDEMSGHNVFDEKEGAIDSFAEIIIAILKDNGILQ